MQNILSHFEDVKKINQTSYSEVTLIRKKDNEELYILKSLKEVKGIDNNALSQKKRFKKEIDIASSFEHKNISRVVGSFSDEKTYALVYNYHNGESLSKIIKNKEPLSIQFVLSIVLQLLSALEYIHSKGIIHCDINPNNIFITEENELKLFDFGLSLREEEALKILEGQVIGTKPYVAPEQLGFTDFKIDTRTDLFGVGILLYQMIAGEHPYKTKTDTIDELLELLLKIEVSPIKNQSISLNKILLKALSPTPSDRYQTATGFKHDITNIFNQILNDKDELFDVGEKDSIIAVNRGNLFVGRDNEVNTLKDAYLKFRKGESFSFIIYGKSGIGKTEIVKKFKESIIDDDIFISSKCNSFTLNQPYSIFREIILEYLSYISKLNDDRKNLFKEQLNSKFKEESGIICDTLPELSTFFNEIKKAGKIEEEKEVDRLIHVLSIFVKFLFDYTRIILFIDDLQWIDNLSFTILKGLINKHSKSFLIFSYRSSKKTKELYLFKEDLMTLGITNFICVLPFTKFDVQNLINSRLGEVENIEQLTNILFTKTEGIPFTVNEALRYLVNSSILKPKKNKWAYDNNELNNLPEKFDAVSLVLKKLDFLNEKEKKYLTISSLIEGSFENEILKDTGEFSDEEVKVISQNLENYGFFSKRLKGDFSFYHDRVQESIKSLIIDEEKFVLYEKLAVIYERRLNSNKEYIFNIAGFYEKTNILEKSIEWSYKAARYATDKFAFDLAIRYYKNTSFMALQSNAMDIHLPSTLFDMQKEFADVLMLTGKNQQALKIFFQLIHEYPNASKESIFDIKYKIGSIYHNMGEFENSIPYFLEILKNFGIKFPTSFFVLLINLLNEIVIQSLYSFVPKRFLKKSISPTNLQKIGILNKLSYSLFFDDMFSCLFAHFKALNFADLTINSAEKAEAFTLHTVPIYQMFQKKRSFNYSCRSKKISEGIFRKDSYAFAESFNGIVLYFNAEWRKSKKSLLSSISNFKSIGDVFNQIVSYEHLWRINLIQGESKTAEHNIVRIIDLCNQTKEKHYLYTSLAGYYYLKLLKDNFEDTTMFNEINNFLKTAKSYLTITHIGIPLLQADILQNNFVSAYKRVKKLIPLILKKSFNSEYNVPVFSLYGELIIAELKNRLEGKGVLPISKIKLKLNFYFTSIMLRFSCISFPAYKGIYYRNLAWFKHLKNKKNVAKKYFLKAIQEHHSLDMRYEEARSIRDYAYFLEDCNLPGDARDFFNNAYRLFEKCDAKLEMDRLNDKVDCDIFHHQTNEQIFENEFISTHSTASSTSEIDSLRVDTLFAVSSSMRDINDIDTLLLQILKALIKATGAQNGYLLIEKTDAHDEKVILLNFKDELLDSNIINFSEDIIEWVKKNHMIMLVKDGATDERLDSEKNGFVRSVLCVPLFRNNRYLGCIYLSNDIVSGLFTKGAEKAAHILSAQAGVLLENAYLMHSYKILNISLETKVREQTKDILSKNEKLQNVNFRLMESEKMKSLLTGTLVHDIKNYATGISQNIRVLAKRHSEELKTQKSLSMMTTSCSDIVDLASNLLDIGKMEEGKLEVKNTKIFFSELKAIINKFIDSLFFLDNGISIKILDPSNPFIIFADKYLIERVLQNLFNNASKYTKEKGEVIVSFSENSSNFFINIYNTSDPIPLEQQNKLFDKYTQLGDKRSIYSKGLGLHFCKMVMHAHNGDILVESNENGNTFILCFIKNANEKLLQNFIDSH